MNWGLNMIKKTLILRALIFFLFFGVSSSFALDKPSSAVMVRVDQMKVVYEQSKNRLTQEQLDKKLYEVVSPLFDFREMARRSLGAKWKQASEEQRIEFVDLFSDLLATNYIKKIRDNIEESTFTVASEQSTSPKTSLVKTIVGYEGKKTSIDYLMRLKNNAWKVYAVIIDNIGLVSNYRSQFGSIVDKNGISGLIQKLRDKK